MPATIEQMTYGTNEHGKPRHVKMGSFRRVDKYTSDKTGEVSFESRSCNGPDDDSPVYRGPYNASCACCWLNHSHTTDKHNQIVDSHS